MKPIARAIAVTTTRYIASFVIGREIVFIWARSLEELKETLKHEFGIEISEARVGTTTYQPSPS